jgi:hypothetical protein
VADAPTCRAIADEYMAQHAKDRLRTDCADQFSPNAARAKASSPGHGDNMRFHLHRSPMP